MIKFFRKIRYNLMSENKTGKYFKYALGEILLVVIGIMIALQANNWNEKRKTNNTIETLIDKIEDDVIADVEHVNNEIAFYEERELMMQRILKKEVTKDDYRQFKYYEILFNYSDFNPNTENLDKLLVLEETVKPEYLPIIKAIKSLKGRKQYKDLAWNDLQKAFTDNVDYYTLSGKDFTFKRDSSSIEKTINFYLTDSNYLNRVFNYSIKNHNVLFEMRIARAGLIKILAQIKQEKHQFNKDELVNLLTSLNLNHYKEVACRSTAKDYPDLKGTRQRLLIFNTTKDTLSVNVTDKYDTNLYEFKLKPGATEAHETWRGGLLNGGDYSKVISVYRDSICLAKFTEEPHGYLIIDNTIVND
ncbi:hypothetical protein [Winogradskyella sp. PE311]|uniref:hypothetical protein n=1 Tax=Winogradskyella sp. PE311 TaxID=3366943 RepID=UPI00397F88C2